jgi:hypothetical protein
MQSQVSDPWSDPWTPAEGRRFWEGYEEFLTHTGTLADDERTVVMEVLA